MNAIDLIRWTAANQRARDDYYAHPTRACPSRRCDNLRDDGMLCPEHERQNRQAAERRRKRVAA